MFHVSHRLIKNQKEYLINVTLDYFTIVSNEILKSNSNQLFNLINAETNYS